MVRTGPTPGRYRPGVAIVAKVPADIEPDSELYSGTLVTAAYRAREGWQVGGISYPGLEPRAVEWESWLEPDRRAFRGWLAVVMVLSVVAGGLTGWVTMTDWRLPDVLALLAWTSLGCALWWAFDVYGPR